MGGPLKPGFAPSPAQYPWTPVNTEQSNSVTIWYITDKCVIVIIIVTNAAQHNVIFSYSKYYLSHFPATGNDFLASIIEMKSDCWLL